MRYFRVMIIMMLAGLLCACHGDGNRQLSGDLVTNPKSATKTNDKKPAIQFERMEFDFGKILQGEVVSYTFHFTNVGTAPLIITGVDKSCGCTASDYPRDPIAPGKTGDIKITYDSKGHHGIQNKVLVVNANTLPSQNVLRIKADVRTPENF